MQQRQEDFRLPLGTVGVHAKRGNSDFRATDVNSVDDLPVALFGAQLDRESFSQRADGWQATWRGEREGHVLELIWNTQTGWQLAFTWCGKQILAGAAPEVKRFSPLVQQTVQAFNEVVLSNPSHLNAIFFPTLPGMPEMVMLPDGVFQTLMMPLHAGRVVDAALRFAAFADLKLQGLASATIVRRAFELHGSDGASAQPEARQAIVAASGLAASPSLASQDLYHAYVLEVCAPFYLMPALLEWLLPLRAQSGALGPNAVLPIGVFESSVLKIRDRQRGLALHWRADLKPSEAHFSASALQESLQCLAEELQAQKAEAQETGVSAQQLEQLMSQARREQIVEALTRAQSLASQEEELDDELDDEVDDAIDDELEATSTPNDGLPQEAIPEPFGVPLRDLFASIKSKEVRKAERGLSIRVSSIITEWNLEVLPPDGLSLSLTGWRRGSNLRDACL